MAQAATSRGLIEVVDDDDDVLATVSEVLRLGGYEVAAARDGGTLLRDLHHHHRLPDLILLDLMMPPPSGFELLSRRLRGPEAARAPALTTWWGTGSRRRSWRGRTPRPTAAPDAPYPSEIIQ